MSTCIPRPKNGLQVKERTSRVPNTIPINENWLHKPKNVLQAYAAPPKNVLQVAPNQLNGIVKVMDPFTEERTSGEWADCLQVGFNRVPLTENTAPRFPSKRAYQHSGPPFKWAPVRLALSAMWNEVPDELHRCRSTHSGKSRYYKIECVLRSGYKDNQTRFVEEWQPT